MSMLDDDIDAIREISDSIVRHQMLADINRRFALDMLLEGNFDLALRTARNAYDDNPTLKNFQFSEEVEKIVSRQAVESDEHSESVERSELSEG